MNVRTTLSNEGAMQSTVNDIEVNAIFDRAEKLKAKNGDWIARVHFKDGTHLNFPDQAALSVLQKIQEAINSGLGHEKLTLIGQTKKYRDNGIEFCSVSSVAHARDGGEITFKGDKGMFPTSKVIFPKREAGRLQMLQTEPPFEERERLAEQLIASVNSGRGSPLGMDPSAASNKSARERLQDIRNKNEESLKKAMPELLDYLRAASNPQNQALSDQLRPEWKAKIDTLCEKFPKIQNHMNDDMPKDSGDLDLYMKTITSIACDASISLSKSIGLEGVVSGVDEARQLLNQLKTSND